MNHTREQHKDMITHPLRWPHVALPLIRKPKFENGNMAVYCPPTNVIDPNKPIEIRIGLLFQDFNQLPTKTYPNVDALLDDGWLVD